MISVLNKLCPDQSPGKQKKKKFRFRAGDQGSMILQKKKNNFFPKQSTVFCSEFYTDSNHVTIFSENSSIKK